MKTLRHSRPMYTFDVIDVDGLVAMNNSFAHARQRVQHSTVRLVVKEFTLTRHKSRNF